MTDCSENSFSGNLSLCLLTEFMKFFQSDIVKPIHYSKLDLWR